MHSTKRFLQDDFRRKSFLQNNFLWTLLCTDTASDTLLLINVCHVVNDMNCILRAVLLTQMTSDTSNGTCLHDILALILGAALYNDALPCKEQARSGASDMQQHIFHMLYMLLCQQLRNAVYDMNRIKRTSLYTATVSKTSVITGLSVRRSAQMPWHAQSSLPVVLVICVLPSHRFPHILQMLPSRSAFARLPHP